MPTTDLRTEVRSSLGALRHDWDQLVAAQPLPSPFLRSWWIEHAAAGRPCIVVVLEGDQLVGGAAFETDRVGRGPLRLERVRCLGQGVLAPDHLDLVARADRRHEVARALWRWLRRPGARVVDLDGLAADGLLAAVLAPHVTTRMPAPYAELSDGVPAYLAARPGKVRSTITRTSKRFDREGVELRRVAPEGIDAGLDRLAELHDTRWSDRSSFLRGWERFRLAAADGARAGEVALFELVDAGGQSVAMELDLVLGDRCCFYQAGRRTEREWRGCGSVLRARIIAEAVEQGASEYDLLRGDEGYKAEWATARRELVHVVMARGAAGHAAVAARRLRDRRLERQRDRADQGPANDQAGTGEVSPAP